MGAIMVIEDHVTMTEIMTAMRERKTIKASQLACAYSALLQYAGMPAETCTPEMMYQSFYYDKDPSTKKEMLAVATSVIMRLLTPPPEANAAVEAQSKGDPKGNENARDVKPGITPGNVSRNKPIKPRASRGGTRRNNFGV
jgi:hypothetical protein